MSQLSEVERHGLRLRVWFALISILGGAGELVAFRRVDAVTSWQWLQYLVVCIAFLAMALWVQRPSRLLTLVAYWIVNGSAMLALWETNAQLAASGQEFQTFAGFKLMLIAGALILPSDPTIAVPLLLANTVLPLIEWATWPRAWRAHTAVGEPLGTLAYGLVALGLFAHRVRNAANQRRIVEAEAAAAGMQRVAHMTLAVRDLANTPLQTLELGLTLLQSGEPNPPELLDRLTRALGRLKELNRMLEPYSANMKWKPGDESMDSRSLIETPPSAATT